MVRPAALVPALLMLAIPRTAAADADALWRIVSQQCVPNQRAYGVPKPCEAVDLTGGSVVLKDRVGATQFLLMPTEHVAGIESPAILAPGTPNYWQAAWQARHYVDERAHQAMPRDTISLAINSMSGRTQNELHIHIDCVRQDVRAALHEHAHAIGAGWAKFPVKLAGHDYMAMRIGQPDLAHSNPFTLLADGISGARDDMGHYTLVAVGASNGFVLLASRAGAVAGASSGEELQDHDCAAAN